MLPTRQHALKGIDYEPSGKEEYAKLVVENNSNSNAVTAKVWRMEAGRYTQIMVKYHGKESLLVVSERAPADNEEELIDAVLKFYEYVDLGKTAILNKANSGSGSNHQSSTRNIMYERGTKPIKDPTKDGRGKSRRPKEDVGFTALGVDCNNTVYKERVLQIFKYAEARSKDETLTEEERKRFTTTDILDNVFIPAYENVREITVRNKTNATLRFMAKKGWLLNNPKKNKLAVYTVVENPFKEEMPAQAEFNQEEQKTKMVADLIASRRNEDGLKC